MKQQEVERRAGMYQAWLSKLLDKADAGKETNEFIALLVYRGIFGRRPANGNLSAILVDEVGK
jgi:hypothetical protein